MSVLSVELRRMLTTPVRWERLLGRTAKGKGNYSFEGEIPGKLQSEAVNVLAPTGEEVVSHAQIYFEGDPGIRRGDRLTLPDGTQPVIWTINTELDDQGRTLYTVIYLGTGGTTA